MATAIITQANENQIAIDSPYNANWLDEFKSSIYYTGRKWGGKGTGWLVNNAVADEAIAVTAKYFEIQDRRGKNADQVAEMEDAADEAALEAEIEQIKANQAYIRERADAIERIISELDSAIGRYSYRSKSHIKGAFAKDRALLAHSLSNAELPIEQLTELHVKGLAAAVRLLEKGYIDCGHGQRIRW